MTLFDKPGRAAMQERGPSEMAQTPTAGWVDGWFLGYELQTLTGSVEGLNQEYYAMDREQSERLSTPGTLQSSVYGNTFVDNYKDIARYHAGDRGALTPKEAAKLAEYDERVEEDKAGGKDVKTSKEMLEAIGAKAQALEHRVSTTSTSIGGDISMFTAGMVASFDPRTDPINAITLPIAGVYGAGARIAARMGMQAATQGVIETVNQITGVQENRRLMGLDHGLANAATQIGMTALGGGLLQGLGDGAAKFGRRWFASPTKPGPRGEPPDSTVPEPPPPPREIPPKHEDFVASAREQGARTVRDSPWGSTPRAQARLVEDLDEFQRQADLFDGPPMDEITVSPKPVGNVQADVAARAADPEVMAEFDVLIARKAEIEEGIGTPPAEHEELIKEFNRLTEKAAKLRVEDPTLSDRARKRRVSQEADLFVDRNELNRKFESDGPVDLPEAYWKLGRVRDALADIEPLVARAYTKADGVGLPSPSDLARVRQMIDRSTTTRPPSPQEVKAAKVAEGAAARPPDTLDSATGPSRSRAEEDAKALADETEAFRDTVIRADLTEETELRLDGFDEPLRLDDDMVVGIDADGKDVTVSVRNFLAENKWDEMALEAATLCKTSKTA